jgi:hypothetical protein
MISNAAWALFLRSSASAISASILKAAASSLSTVTTWSSESEDDEPDADLDRLRFFNRSDFGFASAGLKSWSFSSSELRSAAARVDMLSE